MWVRTVEEWPRANIHPPQPSSRGRFVVDNQGEGGAGRPFRLSFRTL